MSKVAVVYWSGTGNTEAMASAVAEGAKGKGAEVSLLTASEFSSDQVGGYDAIAFGCPSMGAEQLEESEFEPMFAASIVVYCVCVGAGDTLKPALINLFSMWCVRLSLAALLAPEYGLKGVWTAMALELTFRGILFLVRLFWGKWLHHKI